MTQDKNRKRAVRKEASSRGLPYQQVLEERWRPGDEGGLRRKVEEAICRIATAPSAPGPARRLLERKTDLAASLVRIAIGGLRKVSSKFRIEKPPSISTGKWKTEQCVRSISWIVDEGGESLDESERVIVDLACAVAPIVVRRCDGHRASRDQAAIRRDANVWLSGDCYDNEKLCDSDD